MPTIKPHATPNAVTQRYFGSGPWAAITTDASSATKCAGRTNNELKGWCRRWSRILWWDNSIQCAGADDAVPLRRVEWDLRHQLELQRLQVIEQELQQTLAARQRREVAAQPHDVLAHTLSGLIVSLQGTGVLACTEQLSAELSERLATATALAKDGLAGPGRRSSCCTATPPIRSVAGESPARSVRCGRAPPVAVTSRSPGSWWSASQQKRHTSTTRCPRQAAGTGTWSAAPSARDWSASCGGRTDPATRSTGWSSRRRLHRTGSAWPTCR